MSRLAVFAASVAIGVFGYACRTVPADSSLPLEVQVKLKAVGAARTEAARPLRVLRQLQLDEEKDLEGGSLASLALLENGDLLAADNFTDRVYRFQAQAGSWSWSPDLGLQGLEKPSSIGRVGRELWIRDRRGLNVFAPDRSEPRRLKVFLNFFSMALSPDGALFVNPVFRDVKTPRPLVVGLDDEGGKVSELAESEDGGAYGIENQAFLGVSQSQVFVALARRPVVRAYSRATGELEFQREIEHPGFAGLSGLKEDPRFSNPEKGVFNAPRYTAGAQWVDGSLFVLLHLPDPEIWEMDSTGRVLDRFRGRLSIVPVHYFGFQVQREGASRSFWIGCVGPGGLIRVVEFAGASS